MTSRPEMCTFLLLMHSDAERDGKPEEWDAYFKLLRSSDRFRGGSAVGIGTCLRKSGPPGPLHSTLAGYILVSAVDLEDAKSLVPGNPVFEAGGTVEVRELPRS